MYRAERACRFQLSFQQAAAEACKISEEIQQITKERNRQANSGMGYRPIGEKEWPALLRKLDRDNPGYEFWDNPSLIGWTIVLTAKEGKLEASYRWFRTCKDAEVWLLRKKDAGDLR